jgi:lipoate-protein ligase A
VTPRPWAVEVRRASASVLHARAMPGSDDAVASLWWCEVDRPALVLGSAQADTVVDAAACARAGVEVVRRRSGGGAVLLIPGEVVWVDVVLPATDPRWSDDVGRATWWLGEAWAAALAGLGHPDAQVHRGAMVTSAWSQLVCFAGLGPGEVTVAGRKVVGISQRRARGVARFQCAVHRRWDPAALIGLLSPAVLPPEDPAELRDAVATVDVTPGVLRAALLAAL